MTFIGKGSRVYIVYDGRGNEIVNTYIRAKGTNEAEKIAVKYFGQGSSVAYTEI